STPVPQLPKKSDRFHPTKDFLDSLALPLADLVAGMSRRPAVYCASAVRRVLRHVRRGVAVTQVLGELPRVVSLVSADGDGVESLDALHQFHRNLSLGPSARQTRARIDDQAVGVLRQHVPHVRGLGATVLAFAVQAR